MSGQRGGSWLNPLDNIGYYGGQAANAISSGLSNTYLGNQALTFTGSDSSNVYVNNAPSKPSVLGTQAGQPTANSGGSSATTLANQSGSYTGGGTAGLTTEQLNYINRVFDTQKAAYANQLATLDPQRQANELSLQNAYQTKSNYLQQDFDTGTRNLQEATGQVNTAKERSLRDILDQMRVMNQSYNNQLGAYGAGDSSAANLIGQALGAKASRNRGDVLYNTNQQLGAIDDQTQQLNAEFERNKYQLDDWKKTSLNSIASEYLKAKQAIELQMQTADANRYAELAKLSDAYNQQAIDALGQVQGTYATQAQQMMDFYRNQFGEKNVSIDPALQQYAVKPITAGQVGSFNMPTQVNPENSVLSLFRKRPEDQELAY